MAPGSNPKHTILAFFNLYWNCNEKRTKINKKGRDWPFFKKALFLKFNILAKELFGRSLWSIGNSLTKLGYFKRTRWHNSSRLDIFKASFLSLSIFGENWATFCVIWSHFIGSGQMDCCHAWAVSNVLYYLFWRQRDQMLPNFSKICPKRNHSNFNLFVTKAKKVNIKFGCFCKNICHKELSKIAQTSHAWANPFLRPLYFSFLPMRCNDVSNWCLDDNIWAIKVLEV